MHRIDGDAHVNNRFMSEDAATGTAATEVTSDWLNSIQDELAALAEVGGQALDKANNAQVLAAVQWLIANGGTDFLTTIRGGVAEDKDTLKKIVDWAAPLASPALTGTPTAPTASLATNTTQVATTAFVAAALANMVDSAPGALDTLNELAAAMGDDPNFAATITTALALKAPLASPALTGAPTAPTPSAGDSSTRLATTKFVYDNTLSRSDLPVGLITMWSGNSVPAGWTLCNGVAKTDRDGNVFTPPNLSDRFILATTDLSKVKGTGGSDTTSSDGEHLHEAGGISSAGTTLTIDQMPAHSHKSPGHGPRGAAGSANVFVTTDTSYPALYTAMVGGSKEHSHWLQPHDTTRAGDHDHKFTPPYYKLALIAYIGA